MLEMRQKKRKEIKKKHSLCWLSFLSNYSRMALVWSTFHLECRISLQDKLNLWYLKILQVVKVTDILCNLPGFICIITPVTLSVHKTHFCKHYHSQMTHSWKMTKSSLYRALLDNYNRWKTSAFLFHYVLGTSGNKKGIELLTYLTSATWFWSWQAS